MPLPHEAIKTRGGVWPKPVTHIHNNSYLALRPSHFTFKVSSKFPAGERFQVLERNVTRGIDFIVPAYYYEAEFQTMEY